MSAAARCVCGGPETAGFVQETPSVQAALSALLDALGFAAMARDVLGESDRAVLARYARVVLKNSPEDRRRELHTRFALLRLV